MEPAGSLDWQLRDTRPDIVGQGASSEELRADYPALSADTLSAALLVALRERPRMGVTTR